MSLAKIIFTTSIFFCSFANAGFYIEPLLGYHTGKTEYKYKSTILGGFEDKGTLNGIGYGLGLGWTLPFGLSFGAEAEQFDLTAKYESATTTTKSSMLVAYAVVGYFVKPKARAYLGVGALSSKVDSTLQTTLTGSAIKAGLSYEFKNHISANIEYIAYGVNESETEGSAAIKIADTFEYYRSTAAVWNFRFPFGM